MRSLLAKFPASKFEVHSYCSDVKLFESVGIVVQDSMCFWSCPIRSQTMSIEEIFKSRLDESISRSSSSLLRGDAFNLHLRGWSYDPGRGVSSLPSIFWRFAFPLASLPDRRGSKYNVAFDLSASCKENCFPQTSNISRTMKLGRIDSVSSLRGLSSSIKEEEDDESSTISFHVSTKYVYTLTFTSVVTLNRGREKRFCLENPSSHTRLRFALGESNKISMSYGKRVQLDSLFDPRQPMSTLQSLEIQLTPIINDEQDIVNSFVSSSRRAKSNRAYDILFQSKSIPSQFPETFTICFNLTREVVEMVRAGLSTRKRQPISPSKLPISQHHEQNYHDPNAKRIKTSQKSGFHRRWIDSLCLANFFE